VNRIVVTLVSVIAAGILCPRSNAFAHAFLDHADPKVGSTVSTSPAAITIVFTEGVEPKFSRIEVFDENGRKLDTRGLEHPKGDQLVVALPPLKPGKYKVHWSAVSVDTHATEGTFDFSVESP